jgi:hypothetical protein
MTRSFTHAGAEHAAAEAEVFPSHPRSMGQPE